jgi:hypothetical protein
MTLFFQNTLYKIKNISIFKLKKKKKNLLSKSFVNIKCYFFLKDF